MLYSIGIGTNVHMYTLCGQLHLCHRCVPSIVSDRYRFPMSTPNRNYKKKVNKIRNERTPPRRVAFEIETWPRVQYVFGELMRGGEGECLTDRAIDDTSESVSDDGWEYASFRFNNKIQNCVYRMFH